MAGAGKKTFTAGETLTASDVNNYLGDQAVMYFGGTAARSSAIPTPTVGMTSYRGDTKQIESYDGAEWRGMSGLQLVKKQTIGTGVSSVAVTNAFSSTYENYKIIISGGSSTVDDNLNLNLTGSTASYAYGLIYLAFGSNTVVGFQGASGASHLFGGYSMSANGLNMNVDVESPFLAKWTTFKNPFLSTTISGTASCVHKVASSYTGFTVTAGSGTLTGGTIYVYGYGT